LKRGEKVCVIAGRYLVLAVIVYIVVLPSMGETLSVTHELEKLEIRMKFQFLAPRLESAGDCYTISMEGTKVYSTPGLPILPLKTLRVLIPPGGKIKKIEVSGNEAVIKGSYTIKWGQTPIPTGSTPASKTPPNSEVYSSSKQYPGVLFNCVSTQCFRGHVILILNLYPVQYRGKTGSLSYYENMDIRISIVQDEYLIEDTYRGLPIDRSRVIEIVDNPWTLSTYAIGKETNTRINSLVDPDDSYQYVLITNNTLKPYFQPLVNWKNMKGVNATIVNVEEIYNETAYNGTDKAEEVRNFIKDAYFNWETEYVLLGGDVEVIPFRKVEVKKIRGSSAITAEYPPPPNDTYVYCDMYFGALDGNWDNDGDGNYGEGSGGSAGEEVDFFAEVYIGRATVETPIEILNFVNKTITYERGVTQPYLSEALMLGQYLGCSTYGGDYKDKITELFPNNFIITRLYEKNCDYNKTDVINELAEGKHLVNHMGHAFFDHVMKLYRSDVDNLNNIVPFFAYSQGCFCGSFAIFEDAGGEYEALEAVGEHFLFADHGAFAVIMNSAYGFYQPGSVWGPSEYYDYEFFDAIFNESIVNLGRANQDSKEDNVGMVRLTGKMRCCYLELNLLGDPETPIYTLVSPWN